MVHQRSQQQCNTTIVTVIGEGKQNAEKGQTSDRAAMTRPEIKIIKTDALHMFPGTANAVVVTTVAGSGVGVLKRLNQFWQDSYAVSADS